MHIITPYQPAITMFGCDGSVRIYKNKAEAVRILGHSWIMHNVGLVFGLDYVSQHFNLDDSFTFNPARIYGNRGFIMRDDFGNTLKASDFADLRGGYSPYRRRYEFWNGSGPVPGTAKMKSGQHHFRRIASGNARRTAGTFFEEGEVPPRGRRKANYLACSCSDHHVASREIKSWKNFRKTQWK